MRWKLFATLAEVAGENEIDVSVEGDDPTVRDALEALLDERPELEAEVLDESGDLRSHIRLLHEGVDPFHDGGWQTAVSEDDELALFPPVSGG